ncbi:hypothetical protein ABPG75_005444 [Micractinium tetrahymenae]
MALVALCTALDECLRVLRQPQPRQAQVVSATARLRQATWVEDDWEEAAVEKAVLKQVVELGGVLADWGRRIGDATTAPTWEAARDQFGLASAAIHKGSMAVMRGGLAVSSNDLFRWFRAAGAMLDGGQQVLLQLLADMGAGNNSGPLSRAPPSGAASAEALLRVGAVIASANVQALSVLLLLLTSHEREQAAFAAAVATPTNVVPWLGIVATVMRMAMHLASRPGAGFCTPLLNFANVADILVTTAPFARHQAALAAQVPHRVGVVSVLPHILPAALDVVEQALAGSDPPLANGLEPWSAATSAYRLLAAPCCEAGLRKLLHLDSGSGHAILEPVMRMFRLVPLQRPPALNAQSYCRLLAAAAAACGQALDLQAGHAGMAEAEARLEAWGIALLALPTFACMAAQLTRELAADAAAAAAEAAAETAAAAVRPADGAGQAGVKPAAADGAEQAEPGALVAVFCRGASQAADLAAWCTMTADEWGLPDEQRRVETAAALAALQLAHFGLTTTVGAAAAELAETCLTRVACPGGFLSFLEEPSQPDDNEQLARQLRHIHTAACSLVHLLAARSTAPEAGSSAAAAEAGGAQQPKGEMAQPASSSGSSSSQQQKQQQQQQQGQLDGPTAWAEALLVCMSRAFAGLTILFPATISPRQLGASAAAHLYAAPVALQHCGELDSKTALQAAMTLAAAQEACSACLGSAPTKGMQAALQALRAHLSEAVEAAQGEAVRTGGDFYLLVASAEGEWDYDGAGYHQEHISTSPTHVSSVFHVVGSLLPMLSGSAPAAAALAGGGLLQSALLLGLRACPSQDSASEDVALHRARSRYPAFRQKRLRGRQQPRCQICL